MMQHRQIKAKQQQDLEQELRVQKARLERRKRDYKLDQTNGAKRHMISVAMTRVNTIAKKLWEFE